MDSYKSNLVRGARCEEQKKTWTVVWGYNLQKEQKDQFYPLTIGMEGATERRTKLGKDASVRPKIVCFFGINLWGSNLKDTVMR